MRFKMRHSLFFALILSLTMPAYAKSKKTKNNKRIVQIRLDSNNSKSKKAVSKSSQRKLAYLDKSKKRKKVIIVNGEYTEGLNESSFDSLDTRKNIRVNKLKTSRTMCSLDAEVVLDKPDPMPLIHKDDPYLAKPINEKSLLREFRKATEAEMQDEYL